MCVKNWNLWTRVVTKTRNGMERNGLFHSVVFQILRHEAVLYLSPNPKNFDLGIPDPKSKLFANNQNIKERYILSRSILFRVLVTAWMSLLRLRLSRLPAHYGPLLWEFLTCCKRTDIWHCSSWLYFMCTSCMAHASCHPPPPVVTSLASSFAMDSLWI